MLSHTGIPSPYSIIPLNYNMNMRKKEGKWNNLYLKIGIIYKYRMKEQEAGVGYLSAGVFR